MKSFLIMVPLTLFACSSGSPRQEPVSQSAADTPRESLRVAASSVDGLCSGCHLTVYSGHVCGRSVPCALCKREHGARHFHEIVWACKDDGSLMREIHICNDAKTCEECLHAGNRAMRCSLCGEGKHGALLTRGCTWCSGPSGAVTVRGITAYCSECNLEVGTNHLHGKTVFCGTCLREAGTGHTHNVTRLCMQHQRECGRNHRHGQTEYCQACRRDAGPNHRHGETVWCIRCKTEAPWPHCHHIDEY